MFQINTSSVHYWLSDEDLERKITECDETYSDILSHFNIDERWDEASESWTFQDLINHFLDKS